MLDVDQLRRIATDIALGKPPTEYTPEMIAVREEMRAEFEAHKAKHPSAWIDVFDDVDGLPDPA